MGSQMKITGGPSPLKPEVTSAVEEKSVQKVPPKINLEKKLDAKNEKAQLDVEKESENMQSGDDFVGLKVTKKRKRVIESDSEDEAREAAFKKINSSVTPNGKTMNVDSSPKQSKMNGLNGESKAKVSQKEEKSCNLKSEISPKKEKKVESKSSKQSSKIDETKASENEKIAPVVGSKDIERDSTCDTEEFVDVMPVKPNEYHPGKSNYHPIKDCGWKKDQPVPYMCLARTLQAIEEVSSRLKMIEILANYLWSVYIQTPKDLLPSIYLCLNKLCPDYEGIELGIGESFIIKALGMATGRKDDKIKAEIEKKGDLGLVAESSRSNQKLMFQPKPLTVSGVFNDFRAIAKIEGNKSSSLKTDKMQCLIVACRECEARYLVRSLAGKLRIGLAEKSVLSALSQAIVLATEKRLNRNSDRFKELLGDVTHVIKATHCQCPNYGKIIDILLTHGWQELPNKCQITPGIPLKPMLAHPTKGVNEVLKRFEDSKFTCEFKYDGERAQIHVDENGKVEIYSRNQENNTSKYPDLVHRMHEIISEDVKTCILDCEAVAWDRQLKQILPFQVLSTRKRKDATEEEIKVQVCLFAFDILYLNGKPLIKESLRERRKNLQENFKEVEGKFMFAVSRDVDSLEEIQEFLDESVKGKCEGLMVKTLDDDATYEIDKRSHSWLKLKKDYLEGVGDTIDVVVIGAYFGKGKRTGVYGGYLLACYDEENEEFQSICKIGTGFSDEDLKKHHDFFAQHVIDGPRPYYNYDTNLECDVWFESVQVWEVKCADLSISPVHRAALGLVDPEKGISLRFPRFVGVRDDKKPEQATSASQIVYMYNNQEQIKKDDKDKDDGNESE